MVLYVDVTLGLIPQAVPPVVTAAMVKAIVSSTVADTNTCSIGATATSLELISVPEAGVLLSYSSMVS